jgi:two-component system, chemotaxis family, sensor kinase CheA
MENQQNDIDELQEIIRDFVTESTELIESATQDVVSMEENANPEVINGIFRAVHTVKGTASFLGFQVLTTLAHKTEDVLGKVRKGELSLNPHITDVLLQSCDLIKALIEDIGTEGKEVQDTSEMLKKIEDIEKPQPKEKIGEILVEEKVLTRDELDNILKKQDTNQGKKLGEILVEEKVLTEDQLKGFLTKQATPREEQTVRVDVKKLDELMNLVGELVLGKNRLTMISGTIGKNTVSDDTLLDTLGEVTNYVEVITNDLQAAVMRARLVPVSKLFNKVPRLVRDLCAEFGKQVDLKILGQETELDKSLIEALHDPLIHIIRNSIDHGVERPDERKAHGKEPKGTLSLRAYSEGNQVLLEIFDDGKGIDVQAVKDKVKEKGLMGEAELDAMPAKDVMNLIFIAGLSTAKKVSSVSGRGVGMDVVKNNIEKMNGTATVDSEQGKWTRLTIRLPLTLAIMKALILQVREELFAIPLNIVEELVNVEEHAIKHVDKNEVVVIRDKIIPLFDLSRIVSAQPDLEPNTSIIVVNVHDTVMGLKVRSVVGQEEVVIKPLGEFLRHIKWVGGATIRGDGKVILILDLARIISTFARTTRTAA